MAFNNISKEEHLIDFSQTKGRNSEQESFQNWGYSAFVFHSTKSKLVFVKEWQTITPKLQVFISNQSYRYIDKLQSFTIEYNHRIRHYNTRY
jgi:hypothetical protein